MLGGSLPRGHWGSRGLGLQSCSDSDGGDGGDDSDDKDDEDEEEEDSENDGNVMTATI